MSTEIIKKTLLTLVPTDGKPVGNVSLKRSLEAQLSTQGVAVTDEAYWAAQALLIEEGYLAKGQGRGGSVRLIKAPDNGFELKAPTPVAQNDGRPGKKANSAKLGTQRSQEPAQILSYRHPDKRVNNPEVGMVTTATDPEAGKTKWAYDPHLDPSLQFSPQRGAIESLIDDALGTRDPQKMLEALEELKRLQSPYLNWAGKSERTSFAIDTVSLHVHERIDPASILSAVRKAMKGEGKSQGQEKAIQAGLFDAPFESLPLRDAVDFYRHERGWANRMVAGDSLLVMNSMLTKESMAGRIQMFFFDPPYGVKYGSNFQPFVGKRDVKDRSDADLTQEPEMIKAFRDTWELGIHSYLTYLRDRLLLAKDLLANEGSIFVQISDENVHLVRNLMDEVFGTKNFVSLIPFAKTTSSSTTQQLSSVCDYLIWYGKDISRLKYNQLYFEKKVDGAGGGAYRKVRNLVGATRGISDEELSNLDKVPEGWRVFRLDNLTSSRPAGDGDVTAFEFWGKTFTPGKGTFKTDSKGLSRLSLAGRLEPAGNTLSYIRYLDDFLVFPVSGLWQDTTIAGFAADKKYVVETSTKVIERCMLMTTSPGDLVFDPTCGSGTTAFVAEKWGRRWITCDTSRVAITLAKQRLMTASFDYFELKYPNEGLKGGFIYKTVPHITLKSIANNPEIDQIHAQFQPEVHSKLTQLNTELAKAKVTYKVTNGGRQGRVIDLGKGEQLEGWEVPTDWPVEWPEKARSNFDDFQKIQMLLQEQIDKTINAHADQEILVDQPAISRNKLRITGPFTVEAVPFPSVKSLDEASGPDEADASIARTGESGRQHQWRDELLKTGIRGKGGQILRFAELEPLPFDNDIRNLHAIGHLDTGERVAVSFGPEHGALEQRQVESAKNEAGNLFPTPKMLVFCAFAFDPEAAKDIDAIKGITALKAQMNTDLLTEDLKKARSSNQSFWLMGQPEIEVRSLSNGKFEVEVHGFDYFDTVKGELVSGGKNKIAMWSLDPDYDERSLFPRQVFFPQASKGDGWEKLRKTIRAELDEAQLERFHGTISLPFEAGENRKIAIKIVDDRGIESLKVITLQ